MRPPSFCLGSFHAPLTCPGLVPAHSGFCLLGITQPLGYITYLQASKPPFEPDHLIWKALNFCWSPVESQTSLSSEREIPRVSSCTNTKMSSPGVLIYFFTHVQFLQILSSWYETWGTKNIFLSMQICFKLIWRRKWRFHKCWQLIILSAWVRAVSTPDSSPKRAHGNSTQSCLNAGFLPPSDPFHTVSTKSSPFAPQMVKKWGNICLWKLDPYG